MKYGSTGARDQRYSLAFIAHVKRRSIFCWYCRSRKWCADISVPGDLAVSRGSVSGRKEQGHTRWLPISSAVTIPNGLEETWIISMLWSNMKTASILSTRTNFMRDYAPPIPPSSCMYSLTAEKFIPNTLSWKRVWRTSLTLISFW